MFKYLQEREHCKEEDYSKDHGCQLLLQSTIANEGSSGVRVQTSANEGQSGQQDMQNVWYYEAQISNNLQVDIVDN